MFKLQFKYNIIWKDLGLHIYLKNCILLIFAVSNYYLQHLAPTRVSIIFPRFASRGLIVQNTTVTQYVRLHRIPRLFLAIDQIHQSPNDQTSTIHRTAINLVPFSISYFSPLSFRIVRRSRSALRSGQSSPDLAQRGPPVHASKHVKNSDDTLHGVRAKKSASLWFPAGWWMVRALWPKCVTRSLFRRTDYKPAW